jgi:hypothetical protein
MPAFAGALKPEELGELADFLSTRSIDPSRSGKTPEQHAGRE